MQADLQLNSVYICDAIRTPFGRYAGALSAIRTDDLAAIPITAIMRRNPTVDWDRVDDVVLGCANQAGEDNRNVARMAALLAGMNVSVSGATINRLCGSGMDAVTIAARAIACNEAQMIIAGGVESMSRAPFVMPKSERRYARNIEVYDTTLGWRFINPNIKSVYGVDSMPETAEIVARECGIDRVQQDEFALHSQIKTARAQESGFFEREIEPVTITGKSKSGNSCFSKDEHPRRTTAEKLAALSPIVHPQGTVTAGNASGINDGACALLLANEDAVNRFDLIPKAQVLGSATAGLAPRIMGLGPVPSTQKLLSRLRMKLNQMDVIELNEAFAVQALGVLRNLGVEDEDDRVNPNGGAIAIGHPLGASGARLVTTAINQLQTTGQRYALCTMCIGVGQGISMVIERAGCQFVSCSKS